MREGFSSLHFLSFLSKFSPFSGFERRFLLSGRGFELSLYSCGFEGFKALILLDFCGFSDFHLKDFQAAIFR